MRSRLRWACLCAVALIAGLDVSAAEKEYRVKGMVVSVNAPALVKDNPPENAVSTSAMASHATWDLEGLRPASTTSCAPCRGARADQRRWWILPGRFQQPHDVLDAPHARRQSCLHRRRRGVGLSAIGLEIASTFRKMSMKPIKSG